ncbi:MAG: 2-oxoisovalerate dehydrogenase [Candidatus Omnitrophica bacterium]|nr:2-oxoisovalerate dehydrogenase [Candidatus Omnitrophota bacterium]
MEKPVEELVFVVEEAPEGGYTARALGVGIVSEADDLDGLKRQIIDAVYCHFPSEADRPRIIRLHMVKDEVFAA